MKSRHITVAKVTKSLAYYVVAIVHCGSSGTWNRSAVNWFADSKFRSSAPDACLLHNITDATLVLSAGY